MDENQVTPPAWDDIGKDKAATEENLKRMVKEGGDRPLEKLPQRPNPFGDMVRVPRRYLVDEILPCGEVHLIAGPSGAGKSTWLYGEFLPSWSLGEPLLGYDSHPVPYVVVSLERSIPSVRVTLERLRAEHTPVADGRGCLEVEAVIQKGLDVVPEAELFVIEGLAIIAPSGKKGDYAGVAKFLIEAGRLAEAKGYTFIGTVHMPKMHKGELYEDARQRVSGSVAWAAMSDTIILIEREKPGDIENRHRRLTLLPRNAPDAEISYLLDENGLFQPVLEQSVEDAMEMLIEKLPERFKLKEAIAAGKEAGVSRASVCRFLAKCRKIVRFDYGCYRKGPSYTGEK